MSKQWRIVALAAWFVATATVTRVDAGDYPIAGITAFTSEDELAANAGEIRSKVDGLIGELAKFGATPADFAKTNACFFGFVKASADGSVVSYQLDVDAAEQAMEARSWPIPIAYKEAARTACVYDAASNAEACTNPDGSGFALVYYDDAHREFGFLRDPKDIPAARANPAALKHSRIIDCAAFAPFLESHVATGTTEMRTDVRPLILAYFLSRVTNDPDFAKAAEAFFAAKP